VQKLNHPARAGRKKAVFFFGRLLSEVEAFVSFLGEAKKKQAKYR